MQGDRETYLTAGMDDYVSKARSPGRARRGPEPLYPDRGQSAGGVAGRTGTGPRGWRPRPEALEQLRVMTGDRVFMVKLVDTFPARGASAARGRGRAAAASAAHTLRSNGEVFGATRLTEFCREFEAMAKAGKLMAAAELLPRIDEEYARRGALRAAEQDVT
jgi:HPt (histidine-containing phosphotransfer) domain-containing protein